MGRSKSIDDLAKTHDDFNTYILKATADLKARVAPELINFQQAISDFYAKDNYDQQPLGTGTNYDYQQSSTFSLEGISTTVNNFATALFQPGPAATAPSGTAVAVAAKAAQAVTALAGFEGLAVAAAGLFIVEMLGAFNTSVAASYTSTTQQKTLAPGLVLHAYSMNDSFQSVDYFNNDIIVENAISFSLIYSFKMAQVSQDMDVMNAHNAEIEKKLVLIQQMQDDFDVKAADINTPIDTLTAYQNRITLLNGMLDKLRDEVAKVVSAHVGGAK